MSRRIIILSLAALLAAVPSAQGQVFNRKKAEPIVKIEEVQTPEGISEMLLEQKGFTVSYNTSLLLPNWVTYEITPEEAGSKKYSYDGYFKADPRVQKYTANAADYAGSTYVCGQMASPGDMRWSEAAIEATYYFTNVCPMSAGLADGKWLELEQKCRWWAKKYKSPVYVSSGPVFTRPEARYIGDNEVVIPDAFFKVVAQKRDGRWVAAGFIFPNVRLNHDLEKLAKPFAVVEYLTGFRFLRNLPQEDLNSVYSNINPDDWYIPDWQGAQ